MILTATDLANSTPAPFLAALDQPVIGLILALVIIAMAVAGVLFARRRRGPPAAVETIAPPPEDSSVGALRRALSRTRDALQGRFDVLFGGRPVDDALFDELETTLLSADVGIATATRILDKVRAAAKGGEKDPARLRLILRAEMVAILDVPDPTAGPSGAKPHVILVVGVNGSGKTTTIGKIAAKMGGEGRQVLLAAADTFRAAAAEQLTIWSERAKCEIVCLAEGADPGAVVFDALTKAVARGHDVVIIDTAGRLQTKKPLMDQLAKLRRVIDKVVPGGPHETLLVIDGTMGQNALSQAKLFHEATPLTGVVITKLDGTAKGGMVLTLAAELGLPVKLVGVGEKIDDLRPFVAATFVEALA